MSHVEPVTALADNYIWLGRADDGRQALAVDPGEAAPVQAWLEAQEACLAAILLTHHHGDHTGGAAELARRHQAPVYGPASETIAAVDHPLHGGDTVDLAGLGEFQILNCPGHTAGHVAYLWDGYLFCGDALFAGGCGRLFEGTAAQMHTALQRLAALPGTTQICCGHEYTLKNLEFAQRVEPDNQHTAERLEHARAARRQGRATVPAPLDEELATNPFLRVTVPSVRAAAERRAGAELDRPEDVFATLRRWKDSGG